MGSFRQLALIVAIGASTATSAGWEMAGESGTRFINGSQRWEIRIPAGWMYDDTRGSSFSRFGMELTPVRITRVKIKKAFRAIDVRGEEDMLPEELSELYYATILATRELTGSEIVSDEPVEIDDQLGFRLDFRYTDGEGLIWREVHYGLVVRNRFYTISLTTPELYYMDQVLQPFENAVASFDADINTRRR